MYVVEKKQSDKFPIGIDFTNRLDGETITSYDVQTTDSTAVDLTTIALDGNVVTVWLNKDNAVLKPFFVIFYITTNTGKEYVETCRVNVVSDYS